MTVAAGNLRRLPDTPLVSATARAPVGPVAIVGVGLIGGSIGLALRRADRSMEVRGTDSDARALDDALARGALTAAAGSLEEAVDGARCVVVAAPVGVVAGLVSRAVGATAAECLVTDVGSAKAGIVAALDAEERARYIGGHPVAGSERGGIAAAREGLFDGATYFLTPTPEARPDLVERAYGLVAALGARPVAIDPLAHDELMASVSHLPHVLASALIAQAAATAPHGREALRSAGPSFHDLTRVAGSNPPLWADICLANRDALCAALDRHSAQLAGVRAALGQGDREWLADFFAAAARGRRRLLAAADEGGRERWRVRVGVPNRVGVISQVATALGHAHINIEDLALLPAAPGADDGEMALVIAGEDVARRAAALVLEHGFACLVEPA